MDAEDKNNAVKLVFMNFNLKTNSGLSLNKTEGSGRKDKQ